MSNPNANTRVAFIGLGIMGQSMAGHLLEAGYPLSVYNRSTDKMTALVARGARACASTAEAAKDAQVVITMVGFPKDVEEVWLGAGDSSLCPVCIVDRHDHLKPWTGTKTGKRSQCKRS